MQKASMSAEEIYLAPKTTETKETSLSSGETFAENIRDGETVIVEEEPKRGVRMDEIPELRGENRKVYKMSDGTEQAVFYSEAVHVLNRDTNSFETVDNALIEEEDGRHFVNTKNKFVARFSREEENDELFSVKSGMHSVTVFAKKNIKHKNEGVAPRICQKSRDNSEKGDVVRYADVESGADYEYCVQGSGVKEEIVIKEKGAVYRYPFVMKCENVTPEFDETAKRIAFRSNESGEEVFFIPAPFMTDANGITSDRVDYVMRSTADGDIHFTVNADSEWLNDEDRAFPVVIDPQIKLTSSADMTTYSWSNGYMSVGNSHKVGIVGCVTGTQVSNTPSDTQSGTAAATKGTLLSLNNWVSGSISRPNEEKWYTFRATAGSGTYIITTKGSMDTVGYLYDSDNNPIGCNDDCDGLNFRIAACLSGGKTYYIKVRAFSTKTGSYTVGVTTANCTSPQHAIVCYSPHRMYMSFTMPTLPRNPRIKKTMLKIYQKSGASDCGTNAKIGLYQVTGTLGTGYGTPTYNSELIDFAQAKTESYTDGVMTSYSFDITALADKLSRGESSHPKLMLKATDEFLSCQSYVELYGVGSSHSPEIVMDYEASYGVNTSYRTHTHKLGRFGQGSIDLQCGNLMFESEDFTWSGNRMPVTLKHLYNSALSKYQYTANSGIMLNTADFSAMKIGCGFKLNLMQSMVRSVFRHEGTAYVGYVYIGENGEETYFIPSEEQSCGGSQCGCLYKDVNGGETVYHSDTRTLTRGEETLRFDDVGRLIQIADAHNAMQVIYNGAGQITTVVDGAGREFAFAYSNGFLASVTAPDTTAIRYTYSGSLLSAVIYPDGKKAVIDYVSDKPKTVSLLDTAGRTVYKVEYAYSGDKVYSVKEYGANGAEGVKSVYSYSAAAGRTMVLTYELNDDADCDCYETAIKTVYTFNDDGEIISEYIYSEDTGNVAANGEESGIHPHAGDGGAGVVSNINNLLLNHGFDTLNYWSAMSGNDGNFNICNYAYESYTKFGKKLLRMQSNNADSRENGMYQVSETLPKGQYTFSAYLRVLSSFSGENGGAYIRVVAANGEVLAESEHIAKADSEFIRLIAPFELKAAQRVQVQILTDGKGTVYADATQLENNAFANAYNLLTNGNFERDTGWSTSGAYYTTDFSFNMHRALYMTGNLDAVRKAWQRIYVKSNRTTRETFTLSGWAKGCGLPTHERDGAAVPTFRLRAIVKYYDTYYKEYGTEEYTADFSPSTQEWQLASVQFAKSKYRAVEYIDVYLEYDHNFGTAYFDDIQLVRNSIETGLTAEDFETATETESTDDAADETAAQPADETEFKEKTDAYGNALTETTFTDGEFGTIYKSFGFTPDCNCAENAGNDLISETDARGNKTLYTVDEDTSRNEEVTDRLGNKTAYEYDLSGKTTKVISKNASDEKLADVSYTYDAFDNMTEIVRGDGMKYALKYNDFHNLESIGVDGKTDGELIKYTYKAGNGRLKSMTYANGDRMTATYNGIGQMIAEKWYNASNVLTAHYKYVYDGQGNIVRSLDMTGKKEYTYEYEEGEVIRAAEYDIAVSENELIISKCLVNTVRYDYDGDKKLIRKIITHKSGAEQTIYYENSDDKTVVKFTIDGKTITAHSKNDSFGRKSFDELQLGTGFVSRQFHYHPGAVTEEHIDNNMLKSSPTTQLVSQIVFSDGRTVSYEYDAEERITKVTDSVDGVIEYTYDALGQLLTETVNGTVVNSMEYDNYGNIKSKNGVAYTYGDSAWKDLLTAVGDQTIAYDAQGNPTSYLGHTLTWEKGRQLKSFDGNTYTYNANGIRTSKTVNGVKHTYTLDGTKILREEWNENVLVSMYDNEDNICGIIYNDEPYYFQKNLQGDIISIVDKSATVVAKYSYDAWGVCSVTQDDSGCSIATINPFRYRGYYFDSEIGMYYLQSRYYDPSIGRFINADAPNLCMTSNRPIDSNLFAYCYNSPIIDKDVSGKFGLLIAMAIGAFFGVAVQYILDVLTNIINGARNIFRIVSTGWDYVCAAANGALAATGIGKMAAVLWSIVISTVNYIGNVISGKSKYNIWDLIFNVVVGGICGFIGGSGTNLKRITGVVKTSKSVLKTAVSPKKIAMYTAKLRRSFGTAAIGAIRYFFSALVGRLSWPLKNQVKKWA